MKSELLHSFKCECGMYESNHTWQYCPSCGRKSVWQRRIDAVAVILFLVAVAAMLLIVGTLPNS